MELLAGLAIVVAVIAFVQVRNVVVRLRDAERRVHLLESDVFELQVKLSRRTPGRSEAPSTERLGATVAPVEPTRPIAAPTAPAVAPPPPVPPADVWAARWREAHPAERAASTAAGPGDVLGTPPPVPWEAEPSRPAPSGGPDLGPVRDLVRSAVAHLGLTPPSGGEGLTRASLEAWLEGRLLAVVGGLALVLGAVFFLSLAFTRGWITEEMRVLIGLAGGAGSLVLGELALTRVHGIVGHVLVAVGLAIVSLALIAATRLYGLVPVEWGLLGALVAAIAAAVIAIRHDSQLVAAFGLIAVLASPPLLAASPTVITLLFVAVTLVGTTAIALFRTWEWLPPLAFVLAAPQLASYVTGGPAVAEALVVVGGYWLVNVIAAGGEEARRRTDRLRTTTVTLLLADAAFTVWAGFTILSGGDAEWRGTFLLVLAVAHLALALGFLLRSGDRHPFGLIVAATGIAALSMAAPVQFGGPPVAIAWAAEAVALAWVAALRRHPYSGGVSVLLAIAAIAHLIAFEYPPMTVEGGFARSTPFVGPEGLTFGFMLAGLAVAAVPLRAPWIRAGLAVAAGLLAIWVAPFELSGPALVAAWTGVAVVGSVLYVRLVGPALASASRVQDDPVDDLELPPWLGPSVSAVVAAVRSAVAPAWIGGALLAWAGAFGHIVALDYPFLSGGSWFAPSGTFLGGSALAFGIVLLAAVVTGILIATTWIRMWLGAAGVLLTLYVLPFELSGELLVWGWSLVVAAAWVVEARLVDARVAPKLDGAWFVRHSRASLRSVAAVGMTAIVGHVLVLDFLLPWAFDGGLSRIPYAGPEGIALLGAFAALAARGLAYRESWTRIGAAGIALVLVALTLGMEIDRPHVAVAWGVLTVASVLLARRIGDVDPLTRAFRPFAPFASERMPLVAALVAIGGMAWLALTLATPAAFGRAIAGDPLHGSPFADGRTYVFVVLAATIAGCGLAWGGIRPLARAGVLAGLVVAWFLPFEVRTGYAVAGWSALGLAAAWLVRVVPSERRLLGTTAVGVGTVALAVALAFVASPDRLIVDTSTVIPGWSVVTDAAVALGALALAIALGALVHRGERLAMPALAVAGVVAVYGLSVGVVDAFQSQVATRPPDDLEGLQKSAQVGLSVLWSVLGGIGFAAGLRVHRTPIRLFGLALLGLATVKVFLVDLAALDLAYRVLSLVALGVLLLVSALVYARMQRPHGPVTPTHI